jgi:type II secretory pathway pseudopilin PulG
MPNLKTYCSRRSGVVGMRGFTLVETMVVLSLLVMILISAVAATIEMQISSTRTAQVTAAMAVLEAKAQDIRAVYYQTGYFTNKVVYVTNENSIALNEAGTTFLVPGKVISKIEPAGSVGHLVTITATFSTPRIGLTQSVQTVVNKYTGGQQ